MKKLFNVALAILFAISLFAQTAPINPVSLRYYIESINFSKFRTDTILVNDISSANAIELRVSGDNDDYIELSTTANLPQIRGVGGANNTDALKITTDDGNIYITPADSLLIDKPTVFEGQLLKKNVVTLPSNIPSDRTAITAFDDGSSVRLAVTKDDNGTEKVAYIQENTTTINPFMSLSHGGRKENFAGNNGLGQSARAFCIPEQSAEIPGTRTSDVIFTRTTGTWTTDALIGQYAFSYASGTPETGTWLLIADNDDTTLTVTGGTLHATGTAVMTCPWKVLNKLYVHGQGDFAYCGGVFDGQSIWLIPGNSDYLTKVNPATGAMTHYAHGQGDAVYYGGVFDGQSIWLAPYYSDYLTKVNPATGTMTHYAHGQGGAAYRGGVFDGQSIWLAPYYSDYLTKVNPVTGAMTHYAHGQGDYAYAGGVFDGQSIWLVPYNSDYLTKVNPVTGAMTHYAHGQGNEAYIGSVFDGQSIWLAPYYSDYLTKVNPVTGAMTHYAHGQGDAAYRGGVFDGQSIWLAPRNSTNLTKVNPATGAMTHYAHGQGDAAYIGSVFDGQSIWLIPGNSDYLTKVNPPEFGVDVLPVTGSVTTNNFTTNIASGTANKDLTVPPDCLVKSVSLINTLSSGNITDFKGVIDPAVDNITLFSGKTIPNGKSIIITTLADHYYYSTTKTLRFNATGNGAGGIEIIVEYMRMK